VPVATSLRLRGIATHKNRLSEVKEGNLARALNVINDRESIIEPRRGVDYYGSAIASASSGSTARIFPYDGILISHFNGQLYKDNGSGTWTSYSESTTAPTHGGFTAKVRDAQGQSNLYITSTTGIKKLDDAAGTWKAAGVPQPLDSTGSTTGSSGFLSDAHTVGYRAVLYYQDANGNEIVSAPSQTLTVTNSAGGGATRNVAITWYIPSGLSTSYGWRLYRSEEVDSGDPPSDELQLVGEAKLTSSNISAGTFTFTDTTVEAARGETLYTSPSQEGIAQANEPPPLAADLVFYRGHMLYGNVVGRHRFDLALLGVQAVANYLHAENDTGTTTNGSAIVTGLGSTSTKHVGMKLEAASGIPSTARILTIDGPTQVTMTVNATASGARAIEFQDVIRVEGTEYFAAAATNASQKKFRAETSLTPSQNIESTARDFIRCVNANSSAGVYARYESGFDDAPGFIHIYARTLGSSSYQLSSTGPLSFAPALPTTDNSTAVSSADARTSFVMPSKQEQPEAVPLGGGFRCGSSAIKRLLALRDGVIVLSDTVGIITGTGTDNFSYEQLDTTTKLIGPETAVVLNDNVYCMSTQGVVRISPAGVQIASRDIEVDLIKLSALSNFATLAWGEAYESDRSYRLHTPTSASDTSPQAAFRFASFTEGWTHTSSSAMCGTVNPVDDKLYLGHYDNIVRKERKAYDSTDYADESTSVTISGAGSSQTTITVNSSAAAQVGGVVVQGAVSRKIASVPSGTTITLVSAATWSNGAATIYAPISCVVESLPFSFGNAGLMKQFSRVGFIFRDADFLNFDAAVATDLFPNMGDYHLTLETDDLSSTWSVVPAGSDVKDEQVVPTLVPLDLQRAHWIRVRLTFTICRETMALAGISAKFREMSERFRGNGR
jgi:hypothetical protein